MWRSGAVQRRGARAAPKGRRCTYEPLYEVPGSFCIRRWYTLPFKPPALDTNATPRTRYNQRKRSRSRHPRATARGLRLMGCQNS